MTSDQPGNSPGGGPAAGHRRRPRYRGTHPRRFGERYKEQHPEAYPEMQEHVRAQGRTPAGTHVPILVAEVLDALDPRPGDTVADCTLGYGGHAERLLERIGPEGRFVGIDADGAELARTRARLKRSGFAGAFHRSHFAGIGKVMRAEGLDGFDILFADLGVSSMQIDDPGRGFSYRLDGPLDMRMDDRIRMTAADILNQKDEAALSELLRRLGDEPEHAAIARRIVERRAERPFSRTRELTEVLLRVHGWSMARWKEAQRADPGALHPAARVFLALRMAVNDEMGQLGQLLRVAPYCLKPRGRIGILSFHSGEDRLVAQAFETGVGEGTYDAAAGEPIRPGRAERRANPRSASALFRWARRAGSAG